MGNTERILNSLIENLNVGIHIVDSYGETEYYNDAMANIEGFSKEEVIGKKVNEYLENVDEESSTIMKCIKEGRKIKDVVQRYSSNIGKSITTINTTIPIYENQRIIGAIEIAQDMTQFKEVNEKLCKLQSVLKNNQVHYVFNDIIGESELIKKALNKAMRASLSNSPVLIFGETGCGKEVFAQSIHYNGIRGNQPFIPINCAAIPSTLLEGMLFGTTKGSFTGAENRKGLFQLAHRGTILLDEVNSMDTYLQSKLLRVLQDGYIRPIGSNKVIEVDVRIIATINKEPKELIKMGKLREDFYYRLSVISINIPPLRERKEDIPVLTEYFIEHYNNLLGKNIDTIDEEINKKFIKYHWPGNVRELKNVIESAINMSDDERVLHEEFFENNIVKADKNLVLNQYQISHMSLNNYMENLEKRIIKHELKKENYNITQTSKKLGISRQNLQYKIRKYNILQKDA